MGVHSAVVLGLFLLYYPCSRFLLLFGFLLGRQLCFLPLCHHFPLHVAQLSAHTRARAARKVPPVTSTAHFSALWALSIDEKYCKLSRFVVRQLLCSFTTLQTR